MHQLKIQKALNPAYRKIKPNRRAVDEFINALSACKEEIRRSEENNESEEHCKSHIKSFLKDSFYSDYYINTKDRIDLAVYRGKSADSEVGVLLETKKVSNKAEFPSITNLNKKATQELLLYYLRERVDNGNNNIKQLIATNGIEWFLFKGEDFYAHFFKNKKLVKEYEAFRDGRKDSTNNELFYREIASKFIDEVQAELPFVYLDLNAIEFDRLSDRKLNNLYKLFSPVQWLGEQFGNDSNQLNKAFYHELLHIIGLKEVKTGSKKLIDRMPESERSDGSLLENAIEHLDAKDKLSRFKPGEIEGKTRQEKLFTLGLDLCITWINRILFLKLLEAQLKQYNPGQSEFSFLNIGKIKDFDDLDTLFFQVLAKRSADRTARVFQEFGHIPYLNSSLFETTNLEHKGLFISELSDYRKLSVYSKTQLVDPQGKKEKQPLDALSYLFRFLDAYDFAGDTEESIQEDNKTLINASVLGLIFEKINGYKEGSFFTPGFITMYMCRETVRKAVLQKFNAQYELALTDMDELKSYCFHYYKKEDKLAFNRLINELKIADPAVGSGHFLVSALNELLAVKSELGILVDEAGLPLKVSIQVVNDELVITDEEGDLFEYQPQKRESSRIQKSIFHEKQSIIENSLFGVDINPNSVKICRLRLWIELLKHAYYKPADTEEKYPHLETLPNIDINIKSGNSLISRFELDADLSKALKQSKWNIESYQNAVITYRHARNKEQKREMQRIIQDIKGNFRSEINKNDPRKKRLEKARGELFNMTQQTGLFEQTKTQQKAWRNKVEKLNKQIKSLEADIEAIKNNKIYENAFEWRFEFPEVLDDNGDFRGFDIVIGNPPYIRHENFKEIKEYLKTNYKTYQSSADLLTYFVELSDNILKTKGYFQFIISSKFTRASYGHNMRKMLSDSVTATHFIDFGGKPVFDEATVDAAILGYRKIPTTKSDKLIYNVVDKKDDIKNDFNAYIENNAKNYPCKLLNENIWSFDSPEIIKVIDKIEKYGTKLSEWEININFGIKTGFNEAFIIDKQKRKELIDKDPRSSEIIHPLLKGRDIQRYKAKSPTNYLIGTHNGHSQSQMVDISKYPQIKNWLDINWNSIKERYDKGNSPYNLRNCAYWNNFYEPKLVWKRIGSILRFCYDETGAFCLDSTCIATGEKVKYLAAVLNSKLCKKELFRLSPKTGTGDLIISVQALNPLRVPVPTEKQENDVIYLMDQILSAKAEDPAADTQALEDQIDVLVYQLYGLTYAEVRIVDPDFEMSEVEYEGKLGEILNYGEK